MLTPKEQLVEIDFLIAANVSEMKHVRNLLNDPGHAERAIARARQRIERDMAEIAQIEHAQTHGWEKIDQLKTRIDQLQKQRSSVINAVGIEKMKALFLEMQKLENEKALDTNDIAAIVEEIENEESGVDNDESDLPDTT
jgi:chromosome segregation ATPase